MPHVLITGFRRELRKISMTKAIQARAGLGLQDSKAITDAVLTGEQVAISVPSLDEAQALAAELEALGAICEADPE